jgi:hypothetical protein
METEKIELTSAERDLLIHAIRFTRGGHCIWPEEQPLVEPLLEKLGWTKHGTEYWLEKGEKTDEDR